MLNIEETNVNFQNIRQNIFRPKENESRGYGEWIPGQHPSNLNPTEVRVESTSLHFIVHDVKNIRIVGKG